MSTNSSDTLAQTGVLGGRNPIDYTPSDPLALFLVQVCLNGMVDGRGVFDLKRFLHMLNNCLN